MSCPRQQTETGRGMPVAHRDWARDAAQVAWTQVREWLAAHAAWVPLPTDRHELLMGEFCDAPWMTSRLVPDAHLASLAIEHGLRLCSTDGDFARFPGLDWVNPLAAR